MAKPELADLITLWQTCKNFVKYRNFYEEDWREDQDELRDFISDLKEIID